jgi:hypothetical protein
LWNFRMTAVKVEAARDCGTALMSGGRCLRRLRRFDGFALGRYMPALLELFCGPEVPVKIEGVAGHLDRLIARHRETYLRYYGMQSARKSMPD